MVQGHAEIETGEGKLYVATVIDLFSRRLLGYAMGERHDAGLVVAVLNMAAATRGGEDGPVTGFRGRRLGVGGMARERRNGPQPLSAMGRLYGMLLFARSLLRVAQQVLPPYDEVPPLGARGLLGVEPLSSSGGCPYVFGQGIRGCAEPWGQAAWRCG
ncbi:DDE-type integrase/transposase/recombinase [Streptomyces sp. NPDC055134]